MTELRIVVPLYNEAAVVCELVARCVKAGEAAAGSSFEVLLVDDCSTDATPRLLAELEGQRVRVLRPAQNGGQFRAVQLGLRHALGRYIAVFDGDLQDPPETVVELMQAMRSAKRRPVDAVFAVKARRDDPPFFLVAQAVFHAVQFRLSARPIPRGASSYCLLRREVAVAISRVPFAHANLGALISAMSLLALAVPYVKQSRRDGRSRLGSIGHVREALTSMTLTGALARFAGLTSLACASAWLGLHALSTQAPSLALAAWGAGAAALALQLQHRRWLSRLPPVAPSIEE